MLLLLYLSWIRVGMYSWYLEVTVRVSWVRVVLVEMYRIWLAIVGCITGALDGLD